MPPVLEIVAPLFGAIAVGVMTGAVGFFGRDEARVLSRYIFSVAMPIAIVDFMREAGQLDARFAGIALGYLLPLALLSTGVFIASRRAGLTVNQAGSAVFSVSAGNSIFLGLPIALALPGFAPVFLFLMILEGIIPYGVGAALMDWPKGKTSAAGKRAALVGILSRAVRNPIVIAGLLGLFLSQAAIALPAALGETLHFLRPIASPVGLFVLGLYLVLLIGGGAGRPRPLVWGLIGTKLILFPAIAGPLVYLFTGDGTAAAATVLFTMMPSAVSTVILSSVYGVFEREGTTVVALGTVIGLGLIVLFLVILGTA